MIRILNIFIFFLFFYTPLIGQQSPTDKRLADSIQQIINKTKNDTAVIYYESLKDGYCFIFNPQGSYKKGFELLTRAKKINHKFSIIRAYSLIYRSLGRLAQLEDKVPEKEKRLGSADSVLTSQLDFVFKNYEGINLISQAVRPIRLYRDLATSSILKKETYFNKETGGYNLLIAQYALKKYPDYYIHVLFDMAVSFQNRSLTPQAAHYYLLLAEYSDSLHRLDQSLEFYNNLGFTYFADGNYALAQKYYFLSLRSAEKFHPDSFSITENHKDRIINKGITYTNIANIFNLQKNYQQSIDYYKKALPYFIMGGNNEYYASFILRIGNIYGAINELDSAESCLEKAKKLTPLFKDKNQLQAHAFKISSLTAFIFSQKKLFPKAITNALTTVKIADETGDMYMKMGAYEALGNYYALNNEPQKAIPYYNKQLAFRNNLFGWIEKTLSKIYTNKGKAFTQMHKADSAIANLLLAKTYAEKVNIKQEMNSVYKNLADAYAESGKLTDAIIYLKKHIQYKDSLVGDQVTQQVTSIGLKYEGDLKLLEEKNIRETQRLENEKKNEEQAQQKKTLLIILFSVSILVILAAFSLFKIKKANALLASQKIIVEEKNKEITDSIQYAKRIQTALISTEPFLKSNLKDYFIFFKPKDIVSGDFYWAAQQNDRLYIAACDCTGHGVPGAFMSLLNITFLNEAVNQKKLVDTSEIFDSVKESLITHLPQDESQDGMDACLIHINKKTKQISYSAANNKPIIIRGDEIIELPCDKMPVGKSSNIGYFNLFQIDYKENDTLYLFTDGFKDQFGCKTNKKLNSKLFKKLLFEFSSLDFKIQKEKLLSFFNDWKGDLEQTDDVCVIGLKL